jgi:hypothetical protein
MAQFTKTLLSGSTQGRGIKVVATASSGTTIHATGTSSSTIDEVWLYAYNSDTAARLLTVQWGNTTSPDDDIKVSIPPQGGLVLVAPGLTLTGTGSAANTIRAFASAANVVTIHGHVNRIA